MTPVLKWWIMFCASISLFILAYILGAVDYMWHVDSTKLSTVILGLYALTSLYMERNKKGSLADDDDDRESSSSPFVIRDKTPPEPMKNML